MPPTHRPAGPLSAPYAALKKLATADLRSAATSAKLLELVCISLDFLNRECVPVELTSLVPGKTYFFYALKTHPDLLSRPVNKDLFLTESATIRKDWLAWENATSSNMVIEPLAYTMAVVYCAASDLFDRGNKKGPATYFECLIGHLFSRELGVNPAKKVSLPITTALHSNNTVDIWNDKFRVHSGFGMPVFLSFRPFAAFILCRMVSAISNS